LYKFLYILLGIIKLRMIVETNPIIQSEKSQVDYYATGHLFEDFIVTLFNKRSFRLLEWRSDKKASNGAFPLSCTYPDLEFHSLGRYRRRFAIECKWRKKYYRGGIEWATKEQISIYLNYQKECNIPVFVAIGIGGTPKNPERLFITPLDHVSMYTRLYESHLTPFKRSPEQHFDDTSQLELF
jgi:hypothetical protein